MWISPPTLFSLTANSASVFSIMSTTSSARLRRRIPSGVRETLWLCRTKSLVPSSSSSSLSCRESVGCVTCRKFAAPVMLPSLATARKYRNTRNSMAPELLERPIPPFRKIHIPRGRSVLPLSMPSGRLCSGPRVSRPKPEPAGQHAGGAGQTCSGESLIRCGSLATREVTVSRYSSRAFT